MNIIKRKNIFLSLGVMLLLVLFPFVFNSPYILHIMIMVFIYALAAEAWNLLGGYAGQMSLGSAVFFGLGAYTSSILLINFRINPWIGLLVGGLVAVVFSIPLGVVCFKLQGHYFVIATLAVGEIMRILFNSWDYVNSASGLELPIVEDSLKNLVFLTNKVPFYFIILIILGVFVYLVNLITKSKIGYYLLAINKSKEDAAQSVGISITLYKLFAIMISAFFTAIAGSLYAQYLLYIDPKMVFGFDTSLKFLVFAALGGIGTISGPLLGALILVPLSEIVRVFSGGAGLGLDLLFYGILIIIIVLYLPEGIVTLFSVRNLKSLFKFKSPKDKEINELKNRNVSR